ncbi:MULTISPECIES: hypothetical protein [Streptosporangium]|uniref:Chemotaxis protein histidine kinase CheA n=1 Tax=Streptosporangium brasiliense TaxID=47480 RepID=A0ABT9R780_9ACTN|nr:hypothetical protein [Streptosporangium brasiliense]MDP9865107.1 chemotaxis protein histidine kinase CheA [Streptosporangium brasiliense]
MAVPDILRNVTRNVREALSSREGFKEKAKDLPLYVLQSALSGVGQALLIGDRVRSTIKRIGQQDEEESTQTADEPAESAKDDKTEDKPARREPVIFAPRPESASTKEITPETNGAKSRPEPVIFAPAKPKAKPATTEAETVEAKPAEPAEVKATEPVKAETVEAKPAEPEATTPEAKPVETDTAEAEPAKATKTKSAAPKAKSKTAEPKAAEAAVSQPAAAKVEVTEVEVVKPEAADAALVEVTETRVAEPPVATPVPEAVAVPAEPMPGYGQLSIASLRARMRGKTAEQIQELIDYERATTARPEVVRMYENRLAKLEAAG